MNRPHLLAHSIRNASRVGRERMSRQDWSLVIVLAMILSLGALATLLVWWGWR